MYRHRRIVAACTPLVNTQGLAVRSSKTCFCCANRCCCDVKKKVCPDDFLYIERIGEGGFGRVVHVKKKSTQTHYAMKIQLKTALLDTFNDDPSRIDHER